jgi:hypothetical protein
MGHLYYVTPGPRKASPGRSQVHQVKEKTIRGISNLQQQPCRDSTKMSVQARRTCRQDGGLLPGVDHRSCRFLLLIRLPLKVIIADGARVRATAWCGSIGG